MKKALSLFDLHCDTAYEMDRQNQSLQSNDLAISLESARIFQRYIQVMAIWTDTSLSDEEGWSAMQRIFARLKNDNAIKQGFAKFVDSSDQFSQELPTLILGIEDARILAGHQSRVNTLWKMGVRFLTPLWKGQTCIGGAHDTNEGLTDFGKRIVERAINLGMILDISHTSETSAEDIFSIAETFHRPVVATHSNAYEICPVSRNLRLWQMKEILRSGGVVGLNLYTGFLCNLHEAHAEHLFPHIEYFLERGFEKNLCLGCDMDGATMPPEIPSLSALETLAELLLQRNYSEEFVHNLFFANAHRFAKQYI